MKKICLLTLFLPFILGAQLQVRNHNGLTGKKDNPVKVIAQDKSGFLLFATNEDLYSFDGKTCSPLLKRTFKDELEITALFVDSRNEVWMGCKNGNIYCYDRKRLDSSCATKEGEREKITSFCEAGKSIYAGTYGTGILGISNMQVRKYGTTEGLTDNVVYTLLSDGAHKVWAGTDGGISQLLLAGGKVMFSSITAKNGLPDPIVRSLYFHEGHLMAGMQDSGYCFIEPTKKEIYRPALSKQWNLGPVLHVSPFGNGDIVVGTESEGIVLISNNQLGIYDYKSYIKSDKINQVFKDRENQIWVASPRGLSHFISSRFFLLPTGSTPDENKILALTVDRENAIWLGTPAGIGRMSANSSAKMLMEKLPDLQKSIISCAALAPDGSTWFGTYGTGISIIEKSTGKTKQLNVSNKQLSNDNVSSIYFDKNKIFVSTLGGGIDELMVDTVKGSSGFILIRNYSQSDGLGSEYIYATITGTDGTLYAASDGGGLQKKVGDKFQSLGTNLVSNTAFSLCRDQSGHIVATTNADGLIHYDGKTVKTFRLKEGLRDEQPSQIIASDKVLLCIHSKGIDKVNCMDNSVSYYDLPDTDFDPTLNAVVFNNGNIYSGTGSGILTFRTSREANDSIKPLAQIREFFLNYKPFPVDSIVEFKYNQNSMAFNFSGIWLKDPARLVYRYKLQGLEDDWLDSDQGKTVNYNNLNPGQYTFLVQVKNDEDVWSDTAELSFTILTPIWQRWWFWMLVASASIAVLYVFVKYRLRALQRENSLLERRVSERTQQIEKQTRIIEQKNVELEQLSLVASKTDNVVLILDPDGNCEYINESFIKLNGFGLDKIKAEFGGNIFQLSNNSEIKHIVEEAISQKKSVHYESLNKKASSGNEIWESSTLTPIFDENGKLRKIIIIDTDVSLRKKQEQIIIQKNKDITDSIAYARKIQHAILPPLDTMQQHIADLFVLYMTKDIVSGDFYWFGHYGDYSIIAAVDCTGHGVPGAFMSLIGYNQLNRIINEEKIRDPSRILEELNKGVLGVLHKNDSSSRDGMDIAICRVNHVNHTLEFAGAMRPLWIVKSAAGAGAEFNETKADKIPIGTKPSDRSEDIRFHTRFMQMKKGETYYIFTDGYADQFGGTKDKKYSTGKFKDFLITNNHLSLKEIGNVLKTEHLNWKGSFEQVDDILVIGFRH